MTQRHQGAAGDSTTARMLQPTYNIDADSFALLHFDEVDPVRANELIDEFQLTPGTQDK